MTGFSYVVGHANLVHFTFLLFRNTYLTNSKCFKMFNIPYRIPTEINIILKFIKINENVRKLIRRYMTNSILT